MKVYRFRDIYVYVMYYVYVTSGPSLLIESTDSMITESERTILHDYNTIITAIYSNMYIEIMRHQSCHYYATYVCCIGVSHATHMYVFIQSTYSEWLHISCD